MSEKKLALIDGYGFVFRAFHSLPPLTRSDGTPVGAVYGFTNMLIRLLANLHVSHVAVVFDAGSKTFRNDIYSSYKANRPECPPDLIPQFSIVREAAEALNLMVLEKVGFEADDIIATLAKKYASDDFEVLIVSSDKDLMQLVSSNIKMYDAMKNKMIEIKDVLERFSVLPEKVLDVMSLIGDSSDNVPGVKGIGPKTAAELILQFETLENIFLNLDKIKQDKRRQLLQDGIENAKLSKKLIALKEDVEMQITLQDLEIKHIDENRLTSFLEKQGFKSLATRVKKEFITNSSNDKKLIENSDDKANNSNRLDMFQAQENIFNKAQIVKIESIDIFNQIKEKIQNNGIVFIDHNSCKEKLVNITLSTPNRDFIKEIYYYEFVNNELQKDLFGNYSESHIDQDFILQELKKIFCDISIKKIFFDSKNFLRAFFFDIASELNLKGFDDILLMNHLLNSSTKNSSDELINENFSNEETLDNFYEISKEIANEKILQNLANKGFNGDVAKLKEKFFAFKNYALFKLHKTLSSQILSQKLLSCYETYEKPLLPLLAKVEINGIKVDLEKLKNLSKEFEEKINILEANIHEISQEKFNISSTKQLAEILFNKMKINAVKKSKKTGAFSTNSEVLEELAAEGFEIADKILQFRKLSKLKSTYTDSLPKEININSKRIHTHFSSVTTSTGRLSSSNPNLQNIPIKSDEGKKIRESFIASDGCLLISADYSQIELRVIAHIAKIENLIKAFKEDKDIHAITASQIFNVIEEDVTQEMRSKAKAINFGIIYKISAFGLARQLKISRKDAANYMNSYFTTYPEIEIYMENAIDFARKHGFVETISSRKCFVFGINDKNPMIRSEAERFAVNASIQGSAADIIKKAMINLDKKMQEKCVKSKIVLQIHDELLIESPLEEVEEMKLLIKKEMESAFLLDVPLKVDFKVGKSW